MEEEGKEDGAAGWRVDDGWEEAGTDGIEEEARPHQFTISPTPVLIRSHFGSNWHLDILEDRRIERCRATRSGSSLQPPRLLPRASLPPTTITPLLWNMPDPSGLPPALNRTSPPSPSPLPLSLPPLSRTHPPVTAGPRGTRGWVEREIW